MHVHRSSFKIEKIYTPTRLLLFLIFVSLVVSTYEGIPEPSDLIKASPWPEADLLFRKNVKWLGSDCAYSVDLGKSRVLWLFGDTFIATSENNIRGESDMIKNSVGIQSGYDPSTASMQFFWRTQNGKPLSFFPEDNEIWYWPGHGIVLEDKLFIFLMEIRSSSEGLGFELIGWRTVSISNFGQVPAKWKIKWLETPENAFGLILSGSVVHIGEYICVFSVQEPTYTIHLVRWPVERFYGEDLSQPQWWAGEDEGWVIQQDLLELPQPLFSQGQTEFSVHFESFLDRFLEVQTIGFGKADLGFRLADSPTGKWTLIERFYRPEEYRIDEIMIYAAKAHPHLEGADLVITYASNSLDFSRLVANDDLYYPRFLRVMIKSPSEKASRIDVNSIL
jgi:hypothetical protein